MDSTDIPWPVGGQRILINKPTYHISTTNVLGSSSAFRHLHDHICVKAYDNSDIVEQTKCFPGTRTLLLDRMERWVAEPGNAERLIAWLDGPMGSGKTAVARTMAERMTDQKKLIGIFIFRKGHPGRDDASRFITTLAYQLALSIPLVRPFIEAHIRHDPSVLQQSLYRQLDALILEPLREFRSEHPNIDVASLPNLVIVDGLDECGGDGIAAERESKENGQAKVLDLLHRLALSQDVLPFAILILSRPELNIKSWFMVDAHERITYRFTLDASYNPRNDIWLFVTEAFLKILRDHPCRHLLPPNWPYSIMGENQYGKRLTAIEIIVQRSSGQFIYAAVAMKFIGSRDDRPDKRLMAILESRHQDTANSIGSPHAVLDTLYMQILNATNDHQTGKKVLVLNNRLRFTEMGMSMPIHRISSVLSLSIQDFRHWIEKMSSLLSLRHYRLPFLKFHHSSLEEFLRDDNRSKHWCLSNNLDSLNNVGLRALELFANEHYVGAQCAYLCIAMELGKLSRPTDDQGSEYGDYGTFHQEIQRLANFLSMESSYREPVLRFLEKTSLGFFTRTTLNGLRNLKFSYSDPEGNEWDPWIQLFVSHVATLIKPYATRYVVNPHTFSILLCSAYHIPCRELDTAMLETRSKAICCPYSLQSLVTGLMMWPESIENMIVHVFCLPSTSFVSESFVLVLQHLGRLSYTFHHSRATKLFSDLNLSAFMTQELWLTILDCQDQFTPYIRRKLHAVVFKDRIFYNYRGLYEQPTYSSATPSPFQIALAECDSNAFVAYRERWFVIQTRQLGQILVPGIPSLEEYYLHCRRSRAPVWVQLSKYTEKCPCNFGEGCFDHEDVPALLRLVSGSTT